MMNKITRSLVAYIVAISAVVSTLPACAYDKPKDETAQLMSAQLTGVYRNGLAIKTRYYLDNNRIFAVQPGMTSGTLKAHAEVENNTSSEMSIKAELVAADTETVLASDEKTVAAAKKEGFSLETDISAVQGDVTVRITSKDGVYEGAALPKSDTEIVLPQKAPADTWETTFGVHDPSIVKFDNDDTYYVYSSHHPIFTSKDLINWEKHEFNKKVAEISPKTQAFISANIDANVNGTYWAPDVIYVEDDAHPYWMYISVSCGLGGRNSAISLVKSDKPLFWADNSAEIIDEGVVFATKETEDYKTNAIDANIYTDKTDGTRYFIWGSFWGGIQGAKLDKNGFIEGIDYSSDEKIIESCKNFGTSLFTQKNGIAGPEGAWMIDNEELGYRYLFTSYGWLGSNYNTRVARSPLSDKFSEVIGKASGESSTFKDANDVDMGKEFTDGSETMATGYKLIGSYRLGDGKSSELRKDGWNYKIDFNHGDATIHYGTGHNSAIKTDKGYFYVCHTRKNYVEGGAWLQVRKMLWTEDGWPVVSPVVYSGEVEQVLPKSLITGTYDFASVGHTRVMGSKVEHRNFDVPITSSKITLNADGTLADDKGSWTYDDDHTVTITFAKDGNESLNEFYKAGDVVTMKALLSYDKDIQDYVMALTGTDDKHIAQFATKLMDTTITKNTAPGEAVSLDKSHSKPVNANIEDDTIYMGDPAAFVDGDTVYLYGGHDTATTEDYVIPEYICWSSKDMVNWEYHGPVMKATDVSWRSDDIAAWASQVAKHNGKYYLYFCTRDKTADAKQSIGVAVSDSPTGPFVDIGAPLVSGNTTDAEKYGETSWWNDIDPTVWIETDDKGAEHRYLAWGNGVYYMCELNEDMVSVKPGTLKKQNIYRLEKQYTEAPWLYRRQDENGNYYGQYYTFFAQNWREEMAYAVTDDLSSGNWIYKGRIMPPTATSNTNHPSVIDFKGKTYFIYHNGMMPYGSGFRRSVNIQELAFDKDGNVYPLEELSTGISGKASMIVARDGSFVTHEAFENPLFDDQYPLIKYVYPSDKSDDSNTAWEITEPLEKLDGDCYVSIQAVNKPGLYIMEDGLTITLAPYLKKGDGARMTFKTVKALDGGKGVSFESVSRPGMYITKYNNEFLLTEGADVSGCSFVLDDQFRAIIENAYYDNGTVSAAIKNGSLLGDAYMYAAEYDKDTTMLTGVKITRALLTSDNQTVEMSYTKKNDDNLLKVFVWEGMTPRANGAVVTNGKPETVKPSVPEGATSHFAFDGTLTDSITGKDAVVTAWNITGNPTSKTAKFADGCGGGQSVSFSGKGSDGINLGKVITQSKYTISFNMSAKAFTQFTSGLFISKDADNWISAPIGHTTDGSIMVWSKSKEKDFWPFFVSRYRDIPDESWRTITIVANGESNADGSYVALYVDGIRMADGVVRTFDMADTQTYLGVNFWDTPFNGRIDEVYVYDGTALDDAQVKTLYEAVKE